MRASKASSDPKCASNTAAVFGPTPVSLSYAGVRQRLEREPERLKTVAADIGFVKR